MSANPTRRDTLRNAVLAAGALSVSALLRPAAAGAQEDEGEQPDSPVALDDFLVEAVVLEQMTALAYATGAGELAGGDRALRRTFQRFERQEQVHATALRSALDSIGIDPPAAPGAPDDLQAIENVEALDPERAEELSELLAELDDADGPEQHLELLLRLENEQIRFYLAQAPTLDAEDMLRTGVEIAACQAQHVVVLREALDAPPAEAVPELPDEPGG